MLRSWSLFEGPVRQALHSLKYRRNLPLGEVLARQMAEYVCYLGWSVDMVVPIPLGSRRLKERGYNQAGLVAMPLASIQHWRFIPRALVRIRDTRTQVGLTIAERKENVRGAFSAREELVRGKSILLMDDIATTGATLAAGATALMEAGAKNVFGLTLARAGAYHGLTNA
jgi:competence protein ComFC